MRSLKLGLIMLLSLSILAVGSPSWADKKFKTKDYKQGWDDRYYKGDGDPPGWDEGNKTGWHGRGMPPGQAKKYRHRYDRGYDPYYDRRRYEPRGEPEYIPVPVPVPVPTR